MKCQGCFGYSWQISLSIGAVVFMAKFWFKTSFPDGECQTRAVLWAVQLVRSHRAPRPATNGIEPPRNAIANGPRGAPLHTSHRAPRQPGTALCQTLLILMWNTLKWSGMSGSLWTSLDFHCTNNDNRHLKKLITLWNHIGKHGTTGITW